MGGHGKSHNVAAMMASANRASAKVIEERGLLRAMTSIRLTYERGFPIGVS
jgi:hypothetical protein